jgi:DNA-binding NarL/FixJ family response regulator
MTSLDDFSSAAAGPVDAARSAPPKVRILVVDDHPAVRLGVVQLLDAQPDFEVVTVVINAESALASAASERVDVAVVDYQLPGHSGLWLCARLKRAPAAPGVVVFSAFADHHLAACGAVAGADAVLNKGALGSELCDAVRYVARGRRLLPRVPQPLADSLRRKLAEPEQLVFGMLLAAIPREQISRTLEIGERELEARIATILRALEAVPSERWSQPHTQGALDLDRPIRVRRAGPTAGRASSAARGPVAGQA